MFEKREKTECIKPDRHSQAEGRGSSARCHSHGQAEQKRIQKKWLALFSPLCQKERRQPTKFFWRQSVATLSLVGTFKTSEFKFDHNGTILVLFSFTTLLGTMDCELLPRQLSLRAQSPHGHKRPWLPFILSSPHTHTHGCILSSKELLETVFNTGHALSLKWLCVCLCV